MQHAVARCVLCYVAFIYFPPATRVTAIAIVVLLCYAYSLVRMRRA